MEKTDKEFWLKKRENKRVNGGEGNSSSNKGNGGGGNGSGNGGNGGGVHGRRYG